jgi:hypothetical protein
VDVKALAELHIYFDGSEFLFEDKDWMQWIRYQISQSKRIARTFKIYEDTDPPSYRFYFPEYRRDLNANLMLNYPGNYDLI